METMMSWGAEEWQGARLARCEVGRRAWGVRKRVTLQSMLS